MLYLLRRPLAALLTIGLVAGTFFVGKSETTSATPAAQSSATASPQPDATASAQPDAAATQAPGTTQYGDLSHLTYTATGDLTASFVNPTEGHAEMIPVSQVTVSTVAGAGIELQADGKVVPVKQLGKRTVNIKTGETQYFFYGVPLVAGPNTLTATPLGADGLRGAPVSETVYGPGDPVTIRADMASPLVADGSTPAALNISMVDRWGNAIAPGNRLTVKIVSGDAYFINLPNAAASGAGATPAPDVNSSSDPHASARVFEAPTTPGGFQSVEIVPGLTAGALDVEITVGSVDVHKSIYVAPYLRSVFVNGLVSVGAGSMPASVDGDGIADNGGARRGRVAIFGKGKVAKGTLLTFAYESQNRLAPVSSFGPFVDDPNERPFLTYGDNSQLSAGPQSNDHLYARLDRGQSSLMWGQFNASIGANEAGAYQQLLSGANANLALGKSGRTRLGGFTARNDVAYVQTTLPITGLASLVEPLEPNIVVGSDIVSLVALDRRSGAVISSTPLIRNVDYTIDYATGTLRFINIPLPYDPNFNPQVINLQYQYEGPGVRSQTTGGSLAIDLGADAKTKLQFGYVNDASGVQNYTLFAQSLSRDWSNGSWMISHADSNGNVPTAGQVGTLPTSGSGSALAARLNLHSAIDVLDLGFQTTTEGYTDPFGGLSTPGLLTYSATYTKSLAKRDSLALTYSGQSNNYLGTVSSERDASLLYQWHPSRKFTLLAGLDAHSQSVVSQATPAPVASGEPSPVPLAGGTQLQAHVGAQYQPSQRLSLGVEQYQTLSGSDVGSTQPTQTSAQVTYAFPSKGSLYLRELWSSQPAATFADSTSTLTTGVASTHTTEIGVDRPLSPNTTVSSSYVINGTGDATNIYSALGVQQKFTFGKFLGGNAFVQSADSIGDGGQGFTVWGATLGYANADRMRASLSYQTRAGGGGGSTLGAAFAGQLVPGLAVVGTLQRAYGNGLNAIDDRISFAYRSPTSDRFTSLLDYQRANGSDATDGTGVGSVISFQELYRPWYGLEFAGMFAYKLDGDSEYLARTAAYGARVRQNVGTRFDVGAEVQHVSLPSIGQSASTNFATELGYQVGNSARLAIGYNFSGGVDPSLIGHPNRKGVYVTMTTLIDRIFGWGKH